MAKTEINCSQCQKPYLIENGALNRARARKARLFCGKQCGGEARRLDRSAEEKKEIKRLYDAARRIELAPILKVKKAEYFQRTYDPLKAAVERKKRMPKHVEYCRQPEYKKWKSQYDKQHLAKKEFGEFAEAALILRDIEKEIDSRATRYEIYVANGLVNKALTRRREMQ